jgi:CRISPR type IV-associated protein Csf3
MIYRGEIMTFSPLKIIFYMQTPLCLGHPWINFDSLLAHLYVRKNLPEYRALPSNKPLPLNINLPVKKTVKNSIELYHTSVSQFEFSEVYSKHIYKRFCEKYIDFQKLKRKKLHINQGYFRNFMIALPYLPTPTVSFYVNGDKECIDELLKGLPALGKKTAIGYGFINNYEIEEIDEDYSLFKDGNPMRPIPIQWIDEFQEGGEIIPMAYKIPYWARDSVAPCIIPTV